MTARVLIVGGGVAGLSAAIALRGKASVTLREQAGQVGGKLRKGPLGVEEGAEAFLCRLPEGVAAAGEAGLELTHPQAVPARLWLGGKLQPLPSGTLLGVPGDLRKAAPVLGFRGTARALLDRVLPATHPGDDPAVGAYVRARLGDRVVDRLVDPLLGGVYAGRADELSLRMTTPQLIPALGERSLLDAAHRLAPKPTGRPVFATPVQGMGRLVQRLAEVSGAEVVLGSPVTDLDRDGDGWRVDGERYDAVVLAVPNAPAGKLLAPLGVEVPSLAYASVALATFVFPNDTELPAASGFLVPASERRLIKASTFLSSKWKHIAEGVDGVVVRCSAGRAGAAGDLARSDLELSGVLCAELGEATGMRRRPLETSVVRWGGGLPQYAPGHQGRVAAVRASLPPGLALAGAAWDGVGIPACLRSGTAAGAAVAAGLAAPQA
ncbi:MAG TPA: protoporphyrinogen oxidase [Frankiaceae bacterium]|jgi:oxygen-dependent protoporphyrinogen oxidase|nr:protoporphyrinogen oxidase [Frankiaceae bacterium]